MFNEPIIKCKRSKNDFKTYKTVNDILYIILMSKKQSSVEYHKTVGQEPKFNLFGFLTHPSWRRKLSAAIIFLFFSKLASEKATRGYPKDQIHCANQWSDRVVDMVDNSADLLLSELDVFYRTRETT